MYLGQVTKITDTVAAVLDQIWTLLNGQTWGGWTWTRVQPSGTTAAIYGTRTLSGVTAAIIIAGAAAGSPIMRAPATYTTNCLYIGVNIGGGAYVAWDALAPFGSGRFSGYLFASHWLGNGLNNIRVWVDGAGIVLRIHGTTGVSSNLTIAEAGRILRPYTSSEFPITPYTPEADGYCWGVAHSNPNGGNAVSANWLTAPANDDFGRCDPAGAASAKMGVFLGETGTWRHLKAVSQLWQLTAGTFGNVVNQKLGQLPWVLATADQTPDFIVGEHASFRLAAYVADATQYLSGGVPVASVVAQNGSASQGLIRREIA